MEEQNTNIKNVEVQERTFTIYKPFIACANCQRNLDQKEVCHGRWIKNYCNQFKKAIPGEWDKDFNIGEDRKRAQECKYWLPSSISIAADLSYIAPAPVIDCLQEVDSDHADRLIELFEIGQITK